METRTIVKIPLLAVALMALFASGCSEDPTVHDRCWKVTCGDGLKCDLADGLCKCGGSAIPGADALTLGGVSCGEKGTCQAGRCVYSCGEGAVTCDRGQTLDFADCACKCGGAGGVACPAGMLCSPTSRTCKHETNLCLNKLCERGTTCDEADGLCKCQGVFCGEGEACVDGACAVDLCRGVPCAEGMLCDASDGLCKCGGVPCLGGQSCLCPENQPGCGPMERRCAEAMKCESVFCQNGLTCDPADGLCKCGGAGGEICMPGQACNTRSGNCGDDLCRDKPCNRGPGWMCDPEDGVCKCGGVGGDLCSANQICAYWPDTSFRCVTPCVPCTTIFSDCEPVEIEGETWGCIRDEEAAGEIAYLAKIQPTTTGNCKRRRGDLISECQLASHCVYPKDGASGRCGHYCKADGDQCVYNELGFEFSGTCRSLKDTANCTSDMKTCACQKL